MRALPGARAAADADVPCAARRPVAAAVHAVTAAAVHRLRAPLLRAASRDVDDGVLAVMRKGAQARARAHQARTGERVIDDDDELAAAAPFLEHDWLVEGEREVGGVLRRCRRCGVLQHWPAGDSSCSTVLLHQPAGDIAQEPLHEGQWSGPYAAGALPTCAICAREFRRPVMNTLGKTCGITCAAENKRLANRRARLAAKARKA